MAKSLWASRPRRLIRIMIYSKQSLVILAKDMLVNHKLNKIKTPTQIKKHVKFDSTWFKELCELINLDINHEYFKYVS